MAPSCMLAAILAILGVPSGCAFICFVFHQVKSKANIPKAGIIRERFSIFIIWVKGVNLRKIKINRKHNNKVLTITL